MIRNTFGAKIFGWWKVLNPPWRITRQEHDALVDDVGIQDKARQGRGTKLNQKQKPREMKEGSDSYLPLFLS